MILSKEDYRNYLEADRKSLGKTKSIKSFLFDDIWRFQRTLRRLEYLINCKRNPLIIMFTKLYYRRQSIKLGFDIPYNVFGAGLSIAHYGQIIVNGGAKVGKNCRIHQGVTIGAAARTGSDAPEIGDNAFIGPGAVLLGKIIIADNIAVGANSVVIKSFPIGNITIGGIPGKIISQKGTDNILIKGAKCL
jgi:serine O-acetyltransferase